ncbi:helix-turn-helix domain-containing protein [Streptomyces sp. NPDC048278]|uniref:TetR/AcrR family transcriptional regulator n=1 Tax=Streptomyces sp. NPDC048278 TaxID=3155809 RepID=UPI003435C321
MTRRTSGEGAAAPHLRADAARNRAQVLAAARQAFRELGTAAPLDEIARRAGVNIATLYRRFPDRQALIRQLVIDGYTLVLEAAQTSADASTTDSVENFLMAMVHQRNMLVLPFIGGPVVDDEEVSALQREINATLEKLLDAARGDGTIRCDVTGLDLITSAALACRPLPHIPDAGAAALATRHVRVFLDGLQSSVTRELPPPPAREEIAVHLRQEAA